MGTIVTALILAGIVFLIVRGMARDKKKGKSLSCGCGCSHCGGQCAAQTPSGENAQRRGT